MTSPVEESSRVVQKIIDSGAFDGLRKLVLEELRQSSALRDYVREQVDTSNTLTSTEGGKAQKDRKKVLEELQQELRDRLVERASRAVWEILTNAEGRAAQDIEHTVHETLCRLYEEREGAKQQPQQQQQQQQPAERGGTQQAAACEGGPQGTALPPRPGGAPTASLAGQRPPPRHYGVYGQS